MSSSQRVGYCGKLVEALETREGMGGGKDSGQTTDRHRGVGLSLSKAK